MAPRNGTTSTPPSWSSPSPPTIAHSMAPDGTQQWHHVHSPKLVVTLPPNHSTFNGTRWHPAITSTPPSWSSPSPPTIAHSMAPYDGTQQWHHVHCTLQWQPWCHVQSAKVVRRPPPLLEVRTPIAIAIWGKILGWKKHTSLSHETCFLRKFQQQFFEDVATTPPERPARESESLNSSALLSHKRLKQELILWYPLISSDPNPASHNKQTLEPSVSL